MRHPRLVAVVQEQLCRLTLTSRAFYNDQLGPFVRDLAALTGKEMVLPMNTGAEAVETAIKLSRRWGHQVPGGAGGSGVDRRDGGQLPWTYDDHRQLLHGRGGEE